MALSSYTIMVDSRPNMTKDTIHKRMVKKRRTGLAFSPETPILTAWRTGSLERIKLLSCGE